MYKIAFLTNGRVAWQAPPGPVSRLYLEGYYIPPDGWAVTSQSKIKGWKAGQFGELRKDGYNG